MGRPQPHERGHEVDSGVVGHLAGALLRFGGVVEDAQAVAQPLHGRARRKDRALQGVRRAAARVAGQRGEQPVLGRDHLLAGMQQQKGPGAVRHLGQAGPDAALSEEGGLLVSHHARNRNLRPKVRGARHPEVARAGAHLGQDARRDFEQVGERRIPGLAVQVVEEGARGVGVVRGVHRTARQPRHQPGVDGARGQVAGFRCRAQLRALAKEPGQLGAREVGIQNQSRPPAHLVLVAAAAKFRADRRRAAVLPDDGPAHRLERRAVPQHHRLALVRDADGLQARLPSGVFQRRARDPPGHPPDLLRVVLDPARPGEVLGELRVSAPQDAPVGRHDQGGGAGRALVEGQNRGLSAHNCAPVPGITSPADAVAQPPNPYGTPAAPSRPTSSGTGSPTTVK